MKKGRVNRFRHVVADDQVRIRRAEITAVSLDSVSERGIRVGELGVRGENGCQHDRAPVEGVLPGKVELFFRRERLVIL